MPKYHHRPVHHHPKARQVFLKPAQVLDAEDGNDVDEGGLGDYTECVRTHSRRGSHRTGLLTGANRASEPRVFRRFGSNTRERVYRLPDTGIRDNVYDSKIFESSQNTPLFGSSCLGQGGCPSILRGCVALQPGSNHFLFSKKG